MRRLLAGPAAHVRQEGERPGQRTERVELIRAQRLAEIEIAGRLVLAAPHAGVVDDDIHGSLAERRGERAHAGVVADVTARPPHRAADRGQRRRALALTPARARSLLNVCPMTGPRALELIDAMDPRVEPTWRALEAKATPAYFLTWGWVENWLATLPAEERPPLALIVQDGTPVAAFFLGRRKLRRHVVLTTNARFFNATGSPKHDEICIEHNGLLATPGAGRSLAQLLELLPDDWDELYLPAVDRYAFDDLGAPASLRFHVRIDRESSAPFVDLEAVRGVDGNYVALLGSSTRTQLRRTRRVLGDLEVEVAVDETHAFDIFREMIDLHRARWAARGEAGAFADPWFEGFHRRLIAQRLPHGEIQLVRVRAGGVTIGCLYNLVANGRVMFYQCGLARFEDPHVKPGYVCHAAAIEYNALAGHATYDLLGGDGRYKQNLSTGAVRLVWLRVQRPLARFRIEDRVRTWKRALAAMQERRAARPA